MKILIIFGIIAVIVGCFVIGYLTGKSIGITEQYLADEEDFKKYHQEVLEMLKNPITADIVRKRCDE